MIAGSVECSTAPLYVSAAVEKRDTQTSEEAVEKTLADIRHNMMLSQSRIHALAVQVDRLKKDQHTMTQALIAAAKKERMATDAIGKSSKKLATLLAEKAATQREFGDHQAEFAEVLAILERMGLTPLPAIFVQPDDALEAVRSAGLLASLIPDMQAQTQILLGTLKKLSQLSDSIVQEVKELQNEMQEQREQQEHLKLLLAQKAKLQQASEAELAQQRQASVALAQKATSLQDLLNELKRQESEVDEASPLASNLQLAAHLHFEALRGRLRRPVAGKLVAHFAGDEDYFQKGETIETEPNALVSAFSDALVVFAGPFRSYGQLVILQVGDGYYALLAGMKILYVTAGQFILSGEPIGRMPVEVPLQGVKLDIGKNAPMLYVELRKNSKPVNPAYWWEKGEEGSK